jgi:rhodanese-related sulfurtransferase
LIKNITPKQAKQLMEENASLKLIDVREPWEHKLARLENSQLIPLRELTNQLSKFEASNTFLVYCHHGSRSFYACAFLMQQGFKEVYNLEGGIDAWSRDVDRSIPKY